MRKKIYFAVIGLLSIIALFGSMESARKNSVINKQQHTLDSLNFVLSSVVCERDSLDDRLRAIHAVKFNRTFLTFKKYNPNIDSSTVNNFIKVIEYYGLDSTKEMFNTCIAQICYESSASHYRGKKVIESSGHALGITQIVPTTAFQYLRYTANDEQREEMIKLGASPFYWVDEFSYLYKEEYIGDSLTKKTAYIGPNTRLKIKEWLYSETNNMILWGFIMRHTLEANRFNIDKSLLAYNQGGGFVTRYIREGNAVWKHEYVLNVNYISKHIPENIEA